MKYFFYPLIFTFLCLFSCTDDAINVNGNDSDPIVDGKGMYVNFRIAGLDATSSSRATEYNDSKNGAYFNTGDEWEWGVHHGHVLIFSLEKEKPLSAITENDALFVTKIDLEISSNNANEATDISRDLVLRGSIEDITFDNSKNNYYTVVVLNPADDFPEADGKTFGEWKLQTVEKMWYCIEKTKEDGSKELDKYITMTNAPEWKENGDPVTLQPITLDNTTLFPDKDNITKHSGTFYVQRGVAKITINAPNFWNDALQIFVNEIEGNNFGDITVFYGFTMENVNTKSYPVQITEELSKDFPEIWQTDRFWGKNVSSAITPVFKRVYWGKDPNYSSPTNDLETFKNHPDLLEKLDELPHALGTSGNVVVNENTMAVDLQNNLYSTRVLDRAVYFPFKCIVDDYETFEGTYQEFLESHKLDRDPAFVWDMEWATGKYPQKGYQGDVWNEAYFVRDKELFNSDRKYWFIKKAHDFALTMKARTPTNEWGETASDDAYGFVTQRSIVMTKDGAKKWFRYQFIDIVTDIFLKYAPNYDAQFRQHYLEHFLTINGDFYTMKDLLPEGIKTHPQAEKIYQEISEALGVPLNEEMTYYKNSIMYFYIILRHFLDSEGVTWDPTDLTYKGNNEKYLGRWGCVRNNWYYIHIKNVRQPGSPFVPDPEDKQNDDPGPLYLDVDLRVLSWAKHDISVGF